ncbi:MAG: FeoB-associated Cys-rich membrane protein [Phycisphaerae bacterium]|jgi:hypothetical protein
MWQYIIIGVVIAAAAGWLVIQLRRSLARRGRCDCCNQAKDCPLKDK